MGRKVEYGNCKKAKNHQKKGHKWLIVQYGINRRIVLFQNYLLGCLKRFVMKNIVPSKPKKYMKKTIN
jgi:hypothetical protein